jgi:hypothetical protein
MPSGSSPFTHAITSWIEHPKPVEAPDDQRIAFTQEFLNLSQSRAQKSPGPKAAGKK